MPELHLQTLSEQDEDDEVAEVAVASVKKLVTFSVVVAPHPYSTRTENFRNRTIDVKERRYGGMRKELIQSLKMLPGVNFTNLL